jgi:homoserine kinase
VKRVRVPASIANVGPGFDVLAFAVELWVEVEAEPADRPRWKWDGEGAKELARSENPLSGLPMNGRVRNGIPMGVGLGSSAAARVAAAALRGSSVRDAFLAAAEREGHPDNAAAAAFGGFRLVTRDLNLALPIPDVGVALLVANDPASTDEARLLLPSVVEMADAVHNLGQVAALVDALYRRDWRQLGASLDDRLHQPHRRPLYPWTEDVIEAARSAGAFGAAVCGAGPSVFALTQRDASRRIADAMAAAAGGKGRPLVTRIAGSGMTVQA